MSGSPNPSSIALHNNQEMCLIDQAQRREQQAVESLLELEISDQDLSQSRILDVYNECANIELLDQLALQKPPFSPVKEIFKINSQFHQVSPISQVQSELLLSGRSLHTQAKEYLLKTSRKGSVNETSSFFHSQKRNGGEGLLPHKHKVLSIYQSQQLKPYVPSVQEDPSQFFKKQSLRQEQQEISPWQDNNPQPICNKMQRSQLKIQQINQYYQQQHSKEPQKEVYFTQQNRRMTQAESKKESLQTQSLIKLVKRRQKEIIQRQRHNEKHPQVPSKFQHIQSYVSVQQVNESNLTSSRNVSNIRHSITNQDQKVMQEKVAQLSDLLAQSNMRASRNYQFYPIEPQGIKRMANTQKKSQQQKRLCSVINMSKKPAQMILSELLTDSPLFKDSKWKNLLYAKNNPAVNNKQSIPTKKQGNKYQKLADLLFQQQEIIQQQMQEQNKNSKLLKMTFSQMMNNRRLEQNFSRAQFQSHNLQT